MTNRDSQIVDALKAFPQPMTGEELEDILLALITAYLDDHDAVPSFCFYFALKTSILWQQMDEREDATTH